MAKRYTLVLLRVGSLKYRGVASMAPSRARRMIERAQREGLTLQLRLLPELTRSAEVLGTRVDSFEVMPYDGPVG